jgi:elongation factor Ts
VRFARSGSAELIDKERAIYSAQAADSGKPADIVAKMVEGRISKYLAEVTLLGQPFAIDTEQTVEKYLKSKGATVRGFTLYVVGEGIERKKMISPRKSRRWPRPEQSLRRTNLP